MIRRFILGAICLLILVFPLQAAFAQDGQPVTIPVLSEDDLLPSPVKALPDYKILGDKAIHIKNLGDLKNAVGEQKVLETISFEGGTEGATANYEAGKLVIIEFNTPQAAFDADGKINQALAQSVGPVYRRVGNFAVFVFEGKDEAAANELIGKVKYEKKVQWIGQDPYMSEKYQRANHEYIQSTLAMFVGSIKAVVVGMMTTLLLGTLCGYLYFRIRNRKQEEMQAYSDAGGMTRLNLDGLSAEDQLLLKD